LKISLEILSPPLATAKKIKSNHIDAPKHFFERKEDK